MGSSCMKNTKNETQSLHSNQCETHCGFQKNINLVHPKEVLVDISFISSQSSIESIRYNLSPPKSNNEQVVFNKTRQNRTECISDYYQKRIDSKRFLKPNQSNFQNTITNQSNLSIELEENQTISLTVPKKLTYYKQNDCSQRRVYTKQDLLIRVKKHRKSEVVSAKIN